jgi:hypothetical protein
MRSDGDQVGGLLPRHAEDRIRRTLAGSDEIGLITLLPNRAKEFVQARRNSSEVRRRERRPLLLEKGHHVWGRGTGMDKNESGATHLLTHRAQLVEREG